MRADPARTRATRSWAGSGPPARGRLRALGSRDRYGIGLPVCWPFCLGGLEGRPLLALAMLVRVEEVGCVEAARGHPQIGVSVRYRFRKLVSFSEVQHLCWICRGSGSLRVCQVWR